MMRKLFLLSLMLSTLAVAAPLARDGDVVSIAARLADADDSVRPLQITIRAGTPPPRPTEGPFVRPVRAVALPSGPTPTPLTPRRTLTPTTPEDTPEASDPPPTNSRKTYTRDEVKAAIRSAWGGDDEKAIRVADCESGLNPRATGNGRYGLWQLRMETWRAYGGGSGDPRDASPEEQTRVAYRLYLQRYWFPWAGCA